MVFIISNKACYRNYIVLFVVKKFSLKHICRVYRHEECRKTRSEKVFLIFKILYLWVGHVRYVQYAHVHTQVI